MGDTDPIIQVILGDEGDACLQYDRYGAEAFTPVVFDDPNADMNAVLHFGKSSSGTLESVCSVLSSTLGEIITAETFLIDDRKFRDARKGEEQDAFEQFLNSVPLFKELSRCGNF